MNEDPYKVVVKLADKYSRAGAGEYLTILDDLRELMILARLSICLRIKSHESNAESEIINIRLIRTRGEK